MVVPNGSDGHSPIRRGSVTRFGHIHPDADREVRLASRLVPGPEPNQKSLPAGWTLGGDADREPPLRTGVDRDRAAADRAAIEGRDDGVAPRFVDVVRYLDNRPSLLADGQFGRVAGRGPLVVDQCQLGGSVRSDGLDERDGAGGREQEEQARREQHRLDVCPVSGHPR